VQYKEGENSLNEHLERKDLVDRVDVLLNNFFSFSITLVVRWDCALYKMKLEKAKNPKPLLLK